MTECFSVVVFSRVKQNCLIVILRRGLEIVTDAVTNATNIFSLATKNYGLVDTLVTIFLELLFRYKLRE